MRTKGHDEYRALFRAHPPATERLNRKKVDLLEFLPIFR